MKESASFPKAEVQKLMDGRNIIRVTKARIGKAFPIVACFKLPQNASKPICPKTLKTKNVPRMESPRPETSNADIALTASVPTENLPLQDWPSKK
jgi:hypothetical protein